LSREIQEQQDQVRLLIKLGKEQGYLLYDQVNDAFAAEEHTNEEIDSAFTAFESEGITLYEDASDA
jgi:RNA polymerase primary sigma factor